MSLKNIQYSSTQKNLATSRIKKVLSDLKEASDIEGVVLVEGKDSIIASDLPDSTNYKLEIPEILAMFKELGGYTLGKRCNSMFAHCIFDYNGCKILAKRLKNFTLLVMLQKRGYIGLAMLEIENSIRRIDEILGGTHSNTFRLADLTN
jgi:predicted regulator of Ras-like GTPase activity (Roadblock/LC7/MglB family)